MKGKFTSRKFWVTAISVIVGILSLFGVDEGVVGTISSALLILVPAIIYVITEGKIDAKGASTIDFNAIIELIQKISNKEKKDEPQTTIPDEK